MVSVSPIEPLDQGQSGQFGQDACGEALKRLGVIAADHELVAELGKQGLDALSGLAQERVERLVVELVMAFWRFQANGGGLEQVVLVLAAQVALVADQDAVVQLRLEVVEVMDVVRGGL